MDSLVTSFNCVLPVFLMICLGVLIRHRGIASEEVLRNFSTMAFKTLLPCSLFYNVYAADLDTAFQPKLLLFLVVWLLIWFVINYVLIRRIVSDPRQQGAYIQNSFRTNIAVVGLSLAQNLMGADGLASMTMAITILVPVYNVLAVVTLETCRKGKPDFKRTLLEILKNPLIDACVLGLAFLLLGVKLPVVLERTVSKLGNTGTTLVLIALGGTLRLDGLRDRGKLLTLACLYRLIAAPAIALMLAMLLGFCGEALAVILVCTAAPLATTSYPMAVACHSDHELTAQLVVTSSMLCSFTLFLWVFLLRATGMI